MKTKLLILGGGPAGYVAAIKAAQLGEEVIVVEEKSLGGVCLNVGCIPTKALLKTSDVSNEIKNSKEHGIVSKVDDIDWSTAVSRKNRIVKNLNKGVESLLKYKNIKVINGRGKIVNSHNVLVKTIDDEINIYSENIILATGSKTILPKIKGIELDGVITSTEALDFDNIPKSIVIIGAGVIGLEFATMFNHMGSKVVVVEQQDRILPNEDLEIANELQKILKRQGITFKLSSKIHEIKENDDSLQVLFESNHKEFIQTCEKILVAVGRRARLSSFEELDLKLENGFIWVDENMETSVKGIYAAGDLIGGKQLAHLAFMEGKVAAENALGLNSKINYNAVPSCVYTTPEIATVGLNEDETKSLNIPYRIGSFAFRHNGRALTLGQREGFVKIIIGEDNTILGGQILGAYASEMISEITLAITLSAKADVIAEMIHPHPTLNEAIWEACADAIGKPIHK